MSSTKIRIFTHEGRTYTGFPVRRGDSVVFENDSQNEILRITIDKEDALLDDKGQGVDMIKIAPGGCKALMVSKKYPINSVIRYSATIGSSKTEDPIIVIVE